jgi:hypothetical protein
MAQRGKADVDDHLDRDNCDGAWICGFGHTAERRCHVSELVAGGVALVALAAVIVAASFCCQRRPLPLVQRNKAGS